MVVTLYAPADQSYCPTRMCIRRVKCGRNLTIINAKNTRKKSTIHENADATITCDFCDSDVMGVNFHTASHIDIKLDYR